MSERTETHRELLAWREELPILASTTYLINGSLGAMPRSVADEMALYARTWGERGVRAWSEGWWELPVTVGDLVAPLLGVGPGEVAMQPNVSVALGVLLSALDWPAERNRIVVGERDFPTLHYGLHGERRRGAEIVTIPGEDALGGAPSPETWLAAIDERTRLVALSHVLFRTGAIQDPRPLVARCREVGALLLLDVYQSAGAIPVALAGWGVDLAVGGGVKFLCAGPGASYLWTRPELAPTLRPAVTGWQADEEPFAFRSGPIRPAAGAWRFLTGTPNVPGLHAARPGLRMVNEVGVARIRERSLFLTDVLIAEADAAGIEVRTPREHARRGAAVTLAPPDAERVNRELGERQILCDYRPGAGIRVSPHFYNTADECRHAVRTLAALARR